MLAVNKYIQRIGIVVFALLCLLVSLTALIILTTPYLNKYETSLSQHLSSTLGVPVKVDKVTAGWYWLYPKFTLEGVNILKTPHHAPIAKIRHIELGMNLWRSIVEWRWVPSSIQVAGADVIIEKGIEGRWRLFEESTLDKHYYEIPQTALAWIFSQKRIQFNDVNIQWRLTDGRVFPIRHLQAKLTNKHNRHLVHASGKFAQLIPTEFKLNGIINGAATHTAQWRGNFVVQISDLELNQWLRQEEFAGLKINNGKVDTNLKIQFKGKNFQKITGYLDGQNINLLVDGTEHARLIQRLQGNFSIMHNGAHWEIDTPNTEVRVQGRSWPVNKFYLAYEDTDNPIIYTKIHYLHAQPLLTLLRDNLSTPQTVREALTHLNPSAELQDLQLQYGLQNRHWTLQTGFSNFSSLTWQQYPGLDHVAGTLEMQPNKGKLELRGHKVNVAKHMWLKQAFPINILMGDIRWKKHDGVWDIDGQNLYMQSDNLDVNGEFSWHHIDKKHLGNMELSGGFNFANSKKLLKTFPLVKLNNELAEWLDLALTNQGKASGNVVLHGDLNRFPFKDNSGTFLVTSQIKDAYLKFEPKWPPAENVTGELTFRNNTLSAKVYEGTILNVPFTDIELTIPDMGHDKKVLRLVGDIDSDFVTARDFVDHSPLVKKLAAIKDLNLTGPLSVKLDLKIPLVDTKPNIIDGSVTAKKAKLNVPDWHFALANLAGTINFHDENIDGADITGSLFNHPVKIGLSTQGKPAAKTHVTINGELAVAELPEEWHIKQRGYIDGQTKYFAKFTVPHDEKQMRRLQVKSDLRGLALNYPKPLSKQKDEVWPLLFTSLFHNNDDITILSSLSQFANLHGKFNYTDGKLVNKGMTVHFGKPTTAFKEQSGIMIDGHINQVDLNDWLKVYEHLENHDLPVGDISGIDINIKHLTLYDMQYPHTHFKLKPQEKRWLVSLEGKRINGKIDIPKTKDPVIVAKFKKLNIPKFVGNHHQVEKVDTDSIPNIDVVVDNLSYQDKQLGICKLSLRPHKQHVAIKNFSLNAQSFQLTGTGDWDNDKHTTELSGNISVKDIDYVQSLFKVPNFIHAETGAMKFKLAWPNDFYSPSLKSIQGNIEYEIDHGKIMRLGKKAEKKMGLGKLVSLISLQALPHHLATDFKDVSGKGFPFSKWDGKVKISDGKANITKSEIDGPVAYIEFDGDLHLVNRQCLIQLKVVPYLGGGLPVLAAVAGGPVIGMATFMATEIIGSEIKRNAHYAYTLTGPWDNLSINQIYRPRRQTYRMIN